MRSDCVFFCTIRVRYGEVDKQGIVYNANYAIYTDIAFEEFLRSRGYAFKTLVEEYESEVCHKRSSFEYNASAFEDDLLDVGVRVLNVGNSSFTLGFEVYRQGEDEPLVIADAVYVGYDKHNRRSRPITDVMRKILQV